MAGAGDGGLCVCKQCRRYLQDNEIPPTSVFNINIGEIPAELRGLNTMEVSMITLIVPLVRLTSLRFHDLAHHGNVVAVFNDIGAIMELLPRHPMDTDIIYVNSPDALVPGLKKKFKVSPFLVRRALEWLKRRNKLYTNVRINEQVLAELEKEPESYSANELDADLSATIPVQTTNPLARDEDGDGEDIIEQFIQIPMRGSEENEMRADVLPSVSFTIYLFYII